MKSEKPDVVEPGRSPVRIWAGGLWEPCAPPSADSRNAGSFYFSNSSVYAKNIPKVNLKNPSVGRSQAGGFF